MFSTAVIHTLFQHMEWADAAVWKVALTVPGADRDPFLRDRIRHIHMVQHAFLDVWKGTDPTFRDVSDFTDLLSIREWGRRSYSDALSFLSTLAERDLQRPIVMPWVPEYEKDLGIRFETPTLAETMFQVTNHSTYHRGQVNRRLRELGGNPPLVDFIAWVWTGKPAADWR